MGKEEIREYALGIGADVVGFASIEDYQSEKAPDPKTILPGVKSLVVMGYRELDGPLESDNCRAGFTSRMAVMDLSLKNNYLMTRYIEDQCQVKATSIAVSYPLDMGPEVMGLVGDVSLRHAAVAAGLGVFGRHNLVIHPKFGTRIIFTAILTELEMESDPAIEKELCTQCGLCVENCPGGALDEEGKTDMLKCLKKSQPNGIGGAIKFWRQFGRSSPEEQKELFKDPKFLFLYQAQFLGFQYFCFKCLAVCPACLETGDG